MTQPRARPTATRAAQTGRLHPDFKPPNLHIPKTARPSHKQTTPFRARLPAPNDGSVTRGSAAPAEILRRSAALDVSLLDEDDLVQASESVFLELDQEEPKHG